MKRLSLLVLLIPFLLGASTWNGATVTKFNGSTVTKINEVTISAGGQAAAYFGNLTPSGSSTDTFNTTAAWNGNIVFTCPGTGTRTIDSLGIYAKSAGGTPGKVDIGLYDTSLNLLLHASSPPTVSSTSLSWIEVTGFTGTAQCTGGTNYKLAFSASSSDVLINVTSSGYTTNDYYYDDTDEAYPLIATLGHATNNNASFFIRAHVTAGP
jgi:hypothetical protein